MAGQLRTHVCEAGPPWITGTWKREISRGPAASSLDTSHFRAHVSRAAAAGCSRHGLLPAREPRAGSLVKFVWGEGGERRRIAPSHLQGAFS